MFKFDSALRRISKDPRANFEGPSRQVNKPFVALVRKLRLNAGRGPCLSPLEKTSEERPEARKAKQQGRGTRGPSAYCSLLAMIRHRSAKRGDRKS